MKDKISKKSFYNILRLFDFLTNCPFATVETMSDYYL